MNKLAIFVEGQTEQIFAEKLVIEVAAPIDVGILIEQLSGGKGQSSRRIVLRKGNSDPSDYAFHVLIVDCGQDERVKSDIIDRYDNLAIREKYDQIIGIRDVYPHTRVDIGQLRDNFDFGLPANPLKPIQILAIMEIEAWFLAEHSHFPRIHENLTIERIESELGFNPSIEDMQLRDNPSSDLENIYFLEQMIYDKSRERVERTVNNLDFSIIHDELINRIDDLGSLVQLLRNFFSTP